MNQLCFRFQCRILETWIPEQAGADAGGFFAIVTTLAHQQRWSQALEVLTEMTAEEPRLRPAVVSLDLHT